MYEFVTVIDQHPPLVDMILGYMDGADLATGRKVRQKIAILSIGFGGAVPPVGISGNRDLNFSSVGAPTYVHKLPSANGLLDHYAIRTMGTQ